MGLNVRVRLKDGGGILQMLKKSGISPTCDSDCSILFLVRAFTMFNSFIWDFKIECRRPAQMAPLSDVDILRLQESLAF